MTGILLHKKKILIEKEKKKIYIYIYIASIVIYPTEALCIYLLQV